MLLDDSIQSIAIDQIMMCGVATDYGVKLFNGKKTMAGNDDY